MADQHHCIGTGREESLQPLDTLDVQMVGRLVKKQHIRFPEQKFGQFDSHTPSSGKLTGRTIKIFPAESQSYQRTLYLRMKVSASHHQEAVILMRETVY